MKHEHEVSDGLRHHQPLQQEEDQSDARMEVDCSLNNSAINQSDRIAPFNPTSEQVQQIALEMLQLSAEDVLFDLGCGDARFLITAATRVGGLRCLGFEIDPVFIERAHQSIASLPDSIRERIQVRQVNLLVDPFPLGDTFAIPSEIAETNHCRNLALMDASALYLFLLPKGLEKIKTTILHPLVQFRLQQGKSLKVVAYGFQVHGWVPQKVDRSSKGGIKLYLYQFGPQRER